jgi:GTPase Era involved in 16S rRNA processing
MVSDQTKERFNRTIGEIIAKTSIVSLLAASAQQWPIWKEQVASLLVKNEVQITLALQWVDKTPDAQRMLHDVEREWAMMEPIGEIVDFSDVREAISIFCQALGSGKTPEAAAFRVLAEAFSQGS